MKPRPSSGFSRRSLFWLLLVGIGSFLALVVLSALAGNSSGERAGPNPYSESAIGYRGLMSFLENLDMPVMVSRDRGMAERLDRDALQIVLEPADVGDFTKMALTFGHSGPVLLVLPKWKGLADEKKPAWVGSVDPVDIRAVQQVLAAVVENPQVVRPVALHALTGPYHGAPSLPHPQLVTGDKLNRIIGTDQGTLLGWTEAWGTSVYILSDPDLLNNHGLATGQNARLAGEMIEDLRYGGTVVVDATMQGFTRSPSRWRSLFELPLLPITLLAACASGLLFWMAAVRFGAPVPAPPRLAPGKRGLIDNTAQLLDFGGHFGVLLERYRASAIRQVAAALHAPAGLDTAALGAWLDRVAGARALDTSYADLASDRAEAGKAVGGRDMLSSARRIHHWKTEMLRGSIPD